MKNITTRQLIVEIRKAGPVNVCVLLAHDTTYIEAVKADLIHFLQRGDLDEPAPFRISTACGARFLDAYDPSEAMFDD